MLSRGRARLALAHSVAPRHHRHGDPRLSRRATDLVRENASALLRVHLATRRARTRVSRARRPPRVRERRSRGHVIARLLVRLGRRARQARALLRAVDGTCRGCVASPAELAEAARAQATLENLAPGGDLDLEKLSGKWRMVYTTAGDVLSVLRLGRDTGAVEVGDIYQSFDARGNIQNEIRLSVPLLLVPASQVRARRATEPARFEPAPPSRPSRAAFTSTLTPHTPDSRTNPSGYRWWRGAQG